ncbi:MAG: folylpolyglutamate synthase/dihydrofolate synthase family protein [Alphaproteobacteria bacterium]
MMTSQQLLDQFIALHPKIIDLGLDRVVDLLDRLGRPQDQLPPVIHIAGTNGKGSTLAFIRAILQAMGYKVDCYSSPHLMDFHERILLNGTPIDEARLVELLRDVERINDHRPITFFEITTCAAFLAFKDSKADFLLLETGLGGRLDATNIIEKPALTIITPVSMDHQQYLGDSLPKIATEKAWIQKPLTDSIIASQHPDALAAIQTVAAQIGASPFIYDKDWHYAIRLDGGLVYERKHHAWYDAPAPSLYGAHQYQNLATAIASIDRLHAQGLIARSHEQIQHAIKAGAVAAKWPARMQKINFGALAQTYPDAEIILDGGHNQAAGKQLAINVKALNKKRPAPTVFVVGMLNSKQADDFLAPLAECCDYLFTVSIPDQAASFTASELANVAIGSNHGVTVALTEFDQLYDYLGDINLAADFRMIITGSLYLSGYLLKEWGYQW